MVATSGEPKNKWGLAAVAVTGTVAVGLCVISAPFVTPALRKHCLPFVPATARQIANVIHMCKYNGPRLNSSLRELSNLEFKARTRESESLIDLGSGDGRIVLEAARHGIYSAGVELNAWLVLYSKLKARFTGLSRFAHFQRNDLWKINLSKYDNIVIFGVAEMMPALKDKLMSEAKPDAKIIACRFPMPSWKPAESIDEGIDSVWLYYVNKQDT